MDEAGSPAGSPRDKPPVVSNTVVCGCVSQPALAVLDAARRAHVFPLLVVVTVVSAPSAVSPRALDVLSFFCSTPMLRVDVCMYSLENGQRCYGSASVDWCLVASSRRRHGFIDSFLRCRDSIAVSPHHTARHALLVCYASRFYVRALVVDVTETEKGGGGNSSRRCCACR